MRIARFTRFAAAALALSFVHAGFAWAEGSSIEEATLMERNAKTGEVSTEQLRRILADGSAVIIDARPRAEFVAGHIPGARVIDAPSTEQIVAVEQIAKGNKA